MTAQNESTLLTSWKEIASYLGKGVRTVQRWEVEFGLPVRRPSENRGIVHASRDEINGWLIQWSKRPIGLQDGSTPGDGAGNVQISRELRAEQRRLRDDLHRCLKNLVDECRTLSLHVTPRQETTKETSKDVALAGTKDRASRATSGQD